jgi:hypothetical protein
MQLDGVNSDKCQRRGNNVGTCRLGVSRSQRPNLEASAPHRELRKMDTSISVRVFEWRGEIGMGVDRVGRAGHRKYAPHTRLATFSATAVPDLCEETLLLWMHERLTEWIGQGCPPCWREAPPASPQGTTGVVSRTGAPSGREPARSLPSQTEPPPLEHRGAVGVSDGLKPDGFTPPLW